MAKPTSSDGDKAGSGDPTPVIFYVAFKSAVNVGGKLTSIESWSHDRHAEHMTCEIAGNWVVLTLLDGRKERRRIPMTNVGYIAERLP